MNEQRYKEFLLQRAEEMREVQERLKETGLTEQAYLDWRMSGLSLTDFKKQREQQ